MHLPTPGISGGRRQDRPLAGNRLSRRLAFLGFGWVLFAFLTPSLLARQAPVATPEPFGERIEIRAINVETVVTDRRGRRVPGLTAADFELRVDGKPMPLEFFLEVQQGRAVAPAGSTEKPSPSPQLAARPGDKVPQSYLVFIDELFSPIVQRKAALKKLAGELDRLGADDHMAIVALGDTGLTVLSPWSHSKDQLAAALRSAWQRVGYIPPFAPSSIEQAEESMVNLDNLMIGSREEALESLRTRYFLRTVKGAAQAERAFADTSGRKVMLLISGNWVGCYDKIDSRSGCGIVRPLTDTSNLLGYTPLSHPA